MPGRDVWEDGPFQTVRGSARAMMMREALSGLTELDTAAMRVDLTAGGLDAVSVDECDRCHRSAIAADLRTLETYDGEARVLCDACLHRYWVICADCDRMATWGQAALIAPPWDMRDEYDDEDDWPHICPSCISGGDYESCDSCGGRYAGETPCCRPRYAQMSRSPLPHVFPHCGCDDEDGCGVNQRAGRVPPAVRFHRAEIQSYSYRPDLEFKGTEDLTPGIPATYFGMEIELTAQDPQRMASEAAALLGEHFYMKSDSSISCGFELVTHPATYKWSMESWPWGGWDILAARGIGADRSTGIHIHVNRAAFGLASHDLKWLTFWYKNRRMIEKVARRRDSEFASFDNDERRVVVALKKTGRPRCGNCDGCRMLRNDPNQRRGYWECRYRLMRYSAINLTNSQTYEARVFASSINPVHIKGALALMASTIEYTRQLSANAILRGNGYGWDTFIAWVGERPEYQPLLDCISVIDENGGDN